MKNNNQIGGKTGTSSDYVDGWYMGVTKDLVTGVWVGADERSVHFKTSQTGEGSRTALPIFGKFMEKVYKDPELGFKPGPFPKPGVEINRAYQCPTVYERPDTTAIDSTLIDSLYIPDEYPDSTLNPSTANTSIKPGGKNQGNKSTPASENAPPVNPKIEPKAEVPKTRKEIREDRRQKRSKEKE